MSKFVLAREKQKAFYIAPLKSQANYNIQDITYNINNAIYEMIMSIRTRAWKNISNSVCYLVIWVA